MSNTIEFTSLRRANLERCRLWHEGGVDGWTPERWFTATAGELGVAGNALKKLFRIQDGMASINDPGRNYADRKAAIEAIAEELADTAIYLDLLAASLDINLNDEVCTKFNKTSEKYGFPQRLVTQL